VVMRLALTWVGLGLLANTAVATLSQEAADELQKELDEVQQDYGLFVDPAEDELFDLLQDNGDNADPDVESQEPNVFPEPRYGDDSSEVIERIDEIESITPIKNIQEVKSIKPVKSIKEIKSITPIKSIKEIKNIQEVNEIHPIPDDIAKKFIADHNLVPMDGDGYKGRPQVGAGRYGSEAKVSQRDTNVLKQGLLDAISTLNTIVQKLGDQGLCGQGDDTTSDNPDQYKPVTYDQYGKKYKLPFGKDDIESIDEITSMQEVKSMLPVKKITEVKSITPIKSIQEVTGLYELTDEQADLLRRLNAKWDMGKARRRHRRRRF